MSKFLRLTQPDMIGWWISWDHVTNVYREQGSHFYVVCLSTGEEQNVEVDSDTGREIEAMLKG